VPLLMFGVLSTPVIADPVGLPPPVEATDANVANKSSADIRRNAAGNTLPLQSAADTGATPVVNEMEQTPPRLGAAQPTLPSWLTHSHVNDNALQLINAIRNSRYHGLNPERYGLSELQSAVDALAGTSSSAHTSHAELVKARESLSTRLDTAFYRLAADLGSGTVIPQKVQNRQFREVPKPDITKLYDNVMAGSMTVDDALQQVSQPHEDYRRLTTHMATLLQEKESRQPRVQVPRKGERSVGDQHAEVMDIKRRLIETGDLPSSTVLTPMFDAQLAVVVKAFQKRHGLAETGTVAVRTRRALNMTVEEQIERTAVSLERWRWMPREFGERHVYVNLPNFRLHLMNGEQRIVDMPVVVGATKHATPTFSKDMSYLEFSPTWTVPARIARKELLPLERKRPGYLKSRGFEYITWVKGKLRKVPYSKVSRADLSKVPFPYTLRQKPGGRNALGRMKFMMPNRYAIYLHDTPAKRLFSHQTRAYSHGCVRLSDPDRLASLILQIDGKSFSEAESLIAKQETTRVPLSSPIPTHLAYFTTWIDRDGKLQTRPDVYRYDAALRKALLTKDTLLSVLNDA